MIPLPPAPADPAAALSAFLDWTARSGLELYDHQEEALLELADGNHVLLATPTGSGKSLVALALHYFALGRGERSFYTSPIKALVNEKFFGMCADLHAENVGLMTGDGTVNRDGLVQCCTAEVLSQIALREGRGADVHHVVMDEFHYYADRDRGMAWQVPLLTLTDTRFLLMSATLGDTDAVAEDLRRRTGRPVKVIRSTQRPVPLEFEWRETTVQETVTDLCEAGRAPLYLVHGSQRDAATEAQALTSLKLTSKEGRNALGEALKGQRFDSPFGKTLQRLLRAGIGLHHAGLLPKYRLLVEQLAQRGLLQVICGTDTLGVGVNIPLRTVVFTRLSKFDGDQTRLYSVREFHQIAGRAGRKGFDDIGWVVAQAPEHVIANQRLAAKMGRDGRAVKFVRKKPKGRGYVPWNAAAFAHLQTAQPEALQSVFRIDAGMVMSMVKRPMGLRDLVRLIGLCHDTPAQKLDHRRGFAALFRSLRAAGVIELGSGDGDDGGDGRVRRIARPASGLQRDFSLHHTLSLWLVEALDQLACQHREEEMPPDAFTYDAVSLVEAILDNPMPVLMRQRSAEKGRLIGDLKAQGVPYDERMELIEEVSWPKPLAEWIYTSFNEFSPRHPWVGAEAIRPKSIVRDMAERWCSFDEYVRDLDLAPVEGVLLRYLTNAFKTLVQNVPDDLKTDDLIAIIGYLRATLARVDASLIEEWERLRGGELSAQLLPELPQRPKVVGVTAKAREAEMRATAIELVRLLCDHDWQRAAGLFETEPRADLAPDEKIDDSGHATGWTAEQIETLVTDWEADHGALVWQHNIRLKGNANVRKVGPWWEVTVGVTGQQDDGDLTVHLTDTSNALELQMI